MPRSRPALALLSGLGVLAALLPGCERPVVQVTPARIAAVEATATSVESGVVKAGRDSILSIPSSGRIVQVFHKKGDRVRGGEPLIRIENDMERIALEEAQVALKRMVALGPNGGASQELLDQARFAAERAQVRYEQTFVRAPFDGVLIELNANLGEMSYGTMPLNLVLGGKKGNTEESLARVIDDSRLYVEADIDEADAGRLRVGQPARITVEALGGKVLDGRLTRIAGAVSTVEGRSRTVRVEIDVAAGPYGVAADDPGAAAPASGPSGAGAVPATGADPPPAAASGLMVGMSADVEVIIERKENVTAVPTLTVIEGEEKCVYVVEGGKLRRRPVKIGIANWEMSEILEGVRPGEMVVVPTDRRQLVDGLSVSTELRAEARRP